MYNTNYNFKGDDMKNKEQIKYILKNLSDTEGFLDVFVNIGNDKPEYRLQFTEHQLRKILNFINKMD